MSQVLNIVINKTNANVVSWTLSGLASVYIGICGTANTFLIHKYETLFEAYENDKPKPVPDKLNERFKQVLEDMKSDELDKKLAKMYMSIRPNLSHIGHSESRFSFRIGVPLWFGYETKADINKNMKVESNLVDWNSDEGKILEESLLLSEKAQKFALAQEVYKCHVFPFYLSLMYPVVGMVVAFSLGVYGKKALQLARKPIQARIVFNTMVGFFAFGVYILLEDKTQMIIERMSLSHLVSLGRDYIEGGIEYFDKQLKTNMALRNLLHDGPKEITVTGNPNFFIRQKSLPLTFQKSFLEDELKALDSKQEELDSKKEELD